MSATKGVTPGPVALLPPIYLYRRILRAHRKHLPAEMRILGDAYVKAEFRAHRNVDNPIHLVSFIPHPPFKNIGSNNGIFEEIQSEIPCG